ncbi:MAG: methyltransferase domain-containing protein [Bacteroidetes bacterium]|nr:methyltransferase domain-containing protein [Bacteroidota bacterium]
MSKVYVVLCMDTEGPCDDPKNTDLLKTWEEVDFAMERLFDERFRKQFPDSVGNNLKIGWFFLTWTGFLTNPRNRNFGYHKVRDHYIERWSKQIEKYGDEDCWHYHHPSKTKIGNEWGFDWTENHEYSTIISRQILDRKWFPVCYRAGGTIHTNESSNWIDNWFPFDYSNRAPISIPNIIDWSKAKSDWTLYKPDIYDFTKPGFGKRYIARTLDLVTGAYSIDESEIKKAFDMAGRGEPAILSVFDHDYRDIADRISRYLSEINRVAKGYPDVTWEYSGPSEAICKSVQFEKSPESILVEAAVYEKMLRIWTTSPIYQNIPWIALEKTNGEVLQVVENVKQDSPLSWELDLSKYDSYLKIGIGVSTINGLSDTFIIKKDENIFESFFSDTLSRHPISPNSINDHSKLYPKLCIDRAAGVVPEMDSIKQLYSILEGINIRGCSLLDVGCASGQISKSISKLGVDYYGIDGYQRGIQIGKLILGQQGFDKSRLRNISPYQLSPNESFDVVVNLFDFRYTAQYDNYLEIISRIAKKYVIIRAPSFGQKYLKRYYPDVLLEPNYQTMRSFFNVYNEDELESFLNHEGFKVTWVEDLRQKEKFNSKPEIVGGIEFSYKYLVAERINEPPTKEEILGKYWGEHASKWRNKGEGLPQ